MKKQTKKPAVKKPAKKTMRKPAVKKAKPRLVDKGVGGVTVTPFERWEEAMKRSEQDRSDRVDVLKPLIERLEKAVATLSVMAQTRAVVIENGTAANPDQISLALEGQRNLLPVSEKPRVPVVDFYADDPHTAVTQESPQPARSEVEIKVGGKSEDGGEDLSAFE